MVDLQCCVSFMHTAKRFSYTYIWMDKEVVVHTHTDTQTHNGILLSHKKEWNNAICSNVDGPRDYHTNFSKSDKDKYHMISLICGI